MSLLHRKHASDLDYVDEHFRARLDALAHELARPHDDELARRRMQAATKHAGIPRREAQGRPHPRDRR